MRLARIVKDYISRHRDKARCERHYYAIQRSLRHTIREATLSRLPGGKRHPHQRRIPLRVLQAAERRLQAIAGQLKAAKSFSELHDLIDRQINPIRGIGDLTVYDIAHRIGAYLRHAPEVVYLHAGTREGARALKLAGKTIEVDRLPAGLRKLLAYEIEDCLCIYKDALHGGRFASRSTCISFDARSC